MLNFYQLLNKLNVTLCAFDYQFLHDVTKLYDTNDLIKTTYDHATFIFILVISVKMLQRGYRKMSSHMQLQLHP